MTDSPTNDTLRLIQCTIGPETYGLDMAWVQSIQRADRLRPMIVTQPADISALRTGPVGWLPGQAEPIPVFSLAAQLAPTSAPLNPVDAGEQRGDSFWQRIIVLRSPTIPDAPAWALLVDRVSPTLPVAAEQLDPLPPLVRDTHYFSATIRQDEGLCLLLCPEKLRPEGKIANGKGQIANIKGQRSNDKGQIANDKGQIANIKGQRSNGKGQIANDKGQGVNLRSRQGRQGRILLFSMATSTLGTEPGLSFGLSISQSPEILKPLPLIPVPGVSPFVAGLVNWRNRTVPVLDLAARLGLAAEVRPAVAEQTRLMIVRDVDDAGQGLWGGFLIAPHIRALRLPIAHQPSLRPIPLNQALVRSIVELENEILVMLNIRRILQPDED